MSPLRERERRRNYLKTSKRMIMVNDDDDRDQIRLHLGVCVFAIDHTFSLFSTYI